MRKFKFFNMLVVVALLTTMFSACVEEKYEGPFYGSVYASPSTVSNGEEIVLTMEPYSISPGVLISVESQINGKSPIKAISYYIDGEWVASSNDKSSDYSATYTIQDLSPGTHTVTAHCETRSDDFIIHETIKEFQITVK